MRCKQIYGLSKCAQNLVSGTQVLLYRRRETRVYPDGREEVVPEHDIYGPDVQVETLEETFSGMFDGEEYPLHRYIFPDGRVLVESVQAAPWSSGPCIFLALKNEKGEWVPESLWLEDAIASA